MNMINIPTKILSRIILSLTFPVLILSQNENYYHLCSPFKCGDITFPFPFSDQSTFGSSGPINCGIPGYQITCDQQESSPVPKLMLSGRLYQVKNIFLNLNQTNNQNGWNLITLVDSDLIRDFDSKSCQSLRNLTIPVYGNSDALGLLPNWTNTNLTFARCPSQLESSQEFLDQISSDYSCSDDGNRLYLWRNDIETPLFDVIPTECKLFMVPASTADVLIMFKNTSVAGRNVEWSQLTNALAAGFPLQWNTSNDCASCQMKGGHCGFDGTNVACFCRDSPDCNSTKTKSIQQKLIIGIASGSSFVVLIVILLLVYKNRASLIFSDLSEKNQTTSDGTTAKEFIQTYRSNLLNNYSYNDMKKMTNGFKEKLGEGGYGNVYKGKFFDGRFIAVKMLKSEEIVGDNFINEVATIGRIHHVNVINLLGFCWDGSKRALIYEYMPNGSLADHLKSENEMSHSLGVTKLMEIAIGVAQGIEYLHSGCESRILHLDIKPQNILLDQNFNPKISDFGLAKVYSRNHSNVTMTGARGTIGYIAPEIFMRNLGNPSHKSDVYSFGMVLLEMVGGRKHFKAATSTSGSAETNYFPEWVYDKILEDKNKLERADFVVEESYYLIERKMLMVGLWCIQINVRDRPSMKRVVEMLCGRLEDIEMPPKPLFFFSSSHQEIEENEITSLGSDSSVLPLAYESLEIQN